MPEIPLITDRVGYPKGPQTPGRSDAVGQALMSEGSKMLDKAVEFNERLKAARRAAESAALQLEATRELNALQHELEKDPAFKDQPQRYWDGAQKIRDKYSKASEDSLVLQDFQEAYDKLTVSKEPSVLDNSWKKEKDYEVGKLDHDTEEYARMVASTNPGPERDALILQGRDNIIRKIYGGFITREEGVNKQQKFLSRVDEIDARRSIASQPEQAYFDLLDPGIYTNLDSITRQQLTEVAQRAVEADIEDKNRAADKREREIEDDFKEIQKTRENEILAKFDNGEKISLIELGEMAINGEISQEGYHYLRNQMYGDSESTTQDNYSYQNEIFQHIFSGDLNAARQMIYEGEGMLKPSTQRTLLNTIRSTESSGENLFNDTEKYYLGFVEDALGVKPFIQLSDERQLLVAQARLEFVERVGLGNEDAKKVSQELVERFAKVTSSSNSLPKPRFGPTPKSVTDIQTQGTELIRKLEAGEIDRMTYDREVGYLKAWKDYLDRLDANPKSGTGEGGNFE